LAASHIEEFNNDVVVNNVADVSDDLRTSNLAVVTFLSVFIETLRILLIVKSKRSLRLRVLVINDDVSVVTNVEESSLASLFVFTLIVNEGFETVLIKDSV
jgi:hypothetical protein